MAISAERAALRTLRSRKGNAIKWGASPDKVRDIDRDLAAERLACIIAESVAAAPPFTPEQRQRLAALLAPAVNAVTPRARTVRRGHSTAA